MITYSAAISACEKGQLPHRALQLQADEKEDKIFAKFSASLGVESVREYEESHLRAGREREEQVTHDTL